MNSTHSSFTGRQRRRTTRWSVKAKDRLAHAVITAGGIGTIIAVSTVCVFLVAVVIPLFRAPEVEDAAATALPPSGSEHPAGVPVHMAVDDYNLMAWSVFSDGVVRKFRLDTGEVLDEVSLAPSHALTAWSFPQRDSMAVFGYENGDVRYANIQFNLNFIEVDDAPEHLRHLKPGETATHEKGLVQMTLERQLRHVTLDVELQDPVPTGANRPVTLIDHTGSRNEVNYAAMTDDGRLFVQRARGRRNMLTGAITYRVTTGEVIYDPRSQLPWRINLTGLGDNLYIIWADGILGRFDIRNYDDIQRVETIDLTSRQGASITAIGNMIGKTTLLVGDSEGTVTAWFRVRPDDIEDNPNLTVRMRELKFDSQGLNRGQAVDVKVRQRVAADELALVPTRRFSGLQTQTPVRSLSASQRKRLFVAGYDSGLMSVFNATVGQRLFDVNMPGGEPVELALFNPRDDGLVGVGRDSIALWRISVPHSEASWAAYFQPVWYEGYPEPQHVWQSTGGTDDFESKFGIRPLVFGTIKATAYSMVFAVPLAILAAIFTSEFLHPKLKMKIKPAIEMMASLPSVVLGFLAGLVVAQYAESRVPAVLLSFVAVPIALIAGACLWQLLPRAFQMRFRYARFLLMVVVVAAGVWIAGLFGPVVERAFFTVRILDAEIAEQLTSELAAVDVEYADGAVVVRDFRTWLSAHRQNPEAPVFESRATGGWMIIFAPLSVAVTLFLATRYVNPLLVERTRGWSRAGGALLDLVKFASGIVAALVLAYALSVVVGQVWDPRGSYIDEYQQRNALIVGIVMGFAVVPIIYTIADDAMSAVPEHLRAASLGAGATRWQTAIRIVVPTAMSGLFSAVMIGFGRAVGETMIVLMAAGNTPIMEWNLFSGFRTLSANIAVEMMEAVEGSTNYRTLFLTAVILFIMTFAINTVAEHVRQRYRKRSYQL